MNDSTKQRQTVSLLGLGPMGLPMTRVLLQKSVPVGVWNRTTSRARALEAEGARVHATPREAAADITLTVLPDLMHVEGLLRGDDGLLAGWHERGVSEPVLVVHGTVSSVAVKDFAARMLEHHGVHVVDAPLSGGTIGARSGTLSIMVGGDPAPVARAMPLFDLMGTTVRHLGPSGSGQLAKACNQIVVAGVIAAESEAMLLARAAGLDLTVLQGLLQGGLAATAVVAQKGGNWIDGDFSTGGSAKNQLKDLRFVAEAASRFDLVLPTTASVTESFQRMIDSGDGELDHTGLYRTIERGSRGGAAESASGV